MCGEPRARPRRWFNTTTQGHLIQNDILKGSMLRTRYRFHGHGSLRYVYKKGRAVRTHTITLKYAKNSWRNHSRFSVVISKKVIKSAVGRNRVRRRVYEIIRSHIPDMNAQYDSAWIIFSANVRTMPHDELENHIYTMLVDAKMISPGQPVPTDSANAPSLV